MDGCLFGYPLSEWEKFTDKLKQLPLSKAQGRKVLRHFFSQATQVDVDKQGRINIPANLRTFADLSKNCVIVGVSDRIEIWDETKWAQLMEETNENLEEIAQSLDFDF
jgi:MraZ protein